MFCWAVVYCSALGSVAHGDRLGDDFFYQSAVKYRCHAGHKLTGVSELICNAKGEWSSALPKCTPVKCPELTTPKHASIDSNNRTYGNVVVATCGVGHQFVGDVSRVECMANGLWSGQLADCRLIECSTLLVPIYAVLVSLNSTYGGYLELKCAPGFVQYGGKATRYCGDGGEWNGSALLCRGKSTTGLYSQCVL